MENKNYCRGATLCLCLFFLLNGLLFANNIKVDRISLSGQNPNEGFVVVNFDLSWENSWRTSLGPANWDAAWLFIKFRVNGNEWRHATLNYEDGSAQGDGHHAPVGAVVTAVEDGVGAFVHRSENGSGSVNWENLGLRWNYASDGVNNNDFVDVDVFAIEMVYVPEGRFTLGGGNGSEIGKFYRASDVSRAAGYVVENDGTIMVSSSGDALYYNSPSTEKAGDQFGPVPATFPVGYDAFYCMKYETTQKQWLSFFNTLTEDQKLKHDLTDLDHRGAFERDRNSVIWDEDGGVSTEHPYVPVTFLFWGDVLAFMDWAGLRPMTELEFVKACRGPIPPVSHEYAWGTSKIIDSDFTYDLLNHGSENELLSNHVGGIGNANWIWSSIFEDGPYRCGIFAASAVQPTREDSGASYYGIMELSGNVSEMAVTIGSADGRAFRGNHGNGALGADGEADVLFWPQPTGEGGGLFGGSWFSLGECLWISDRREATAGNEGYFNDVGFRCVRSAP